MPFPQQNRLGIVGSLLSGGSDFAGYPNGRRPKDDVVDISLVAVMGGLCMANGANNALGFGTACNPSAVPLGTTAFKLHDAVDQAVVPLFQAFPYLNTPNPGFEVGVALRRPGPGAQSSQAAMPSPSERSSALACSPSCRALT